MQRNTEGLFIIDGRKYAIDMERFVEFYSKYDLKSNSSSITQVYSLQSKDIEDPMSGQEMKISNKEVTENKNDRDPNMDNLRYDFAKTLLTTLISPPFNSTGSIYPVKSLEDMYLGQVLCFNTLKYAGILVDVTDDESVEEIE